MSTQNLSKQLRTFIEKAEESPAAGKRLVPAAENLLRLAENTEMELKDAIVDLKQWLAEIRPTSERTS